MLNSFFSTCFNPAFPPLSPSNVSTSNTCDISSTGDLLCTDEEVYGMLSSLDVSKASGPDGVSARMLKMTAEFIAPSVCKLFKISLQTGRVPQGWKQSIIVPVPKISAACTLDDYRPVSLLSVLSKVLERHMYGIITNHLQKFSPSGRILTWKVNCYCLAHNDAQLVEYTRGWCMARLVPSFLI